jgi:hypothetical protein
LPSGRISRKNLAGVDPSPDLKEKPVRALELLVQPDERLSKVIGGPHGA